MKLADYLKAEGIQPADFAHKIRVSRQTVDRYARGQRMPIPSIMGRIVRVTGGKVQPGDFYGTPRARR